VGLNSSDTFCWTLFAKHFGMSAPTMLDLARTASMPEIFSWHKKARYKAGFLRNRRQAG
jgi:hypothetical protein